MDNLNFKSGYSFFNSLLSPANIIEFVKQNNSNVVGIFDTNVMFAYQELTKLAKINNIKVLYGVEVDVFYNSFKHKINLLAKNNIGYQNLCKLSKIISCHDFIGIEINELINYSTGLIIILPSEKSYLKNENVIQYIEDLKLIFSDVYIGAELNELGLIDNQIRELIPPIIPFNLINCNNKEDLEALKVLKATQHNITVNEVTNSFQSPLSEIGYQSLYLKEEINNLNKLIDECNVNISVFHSKFIEYPIQIEDKILYFKELCYKGLYKRLNNKVTETYQKRLDYELEVIIKMGYTDYFLVVWDYVKFAKKSKIMVGPGRGSAASSLVSYVLGITNVDPLVYNLLFERFLNPERISMPDIDIDFLDTRREEVVNYLIDKYGLYQAVHVIAYQTYGVRQALRDASRALGLTPREVDVVAKMVPKINYDIPLEALYQNFKGFKDFIDGRKIYTTIYQIARKLYGLPRQTTLHAAGIVIGNEDLSSMIPVYKQSENVIAVQCDMNYLEANGLLKMDLLALKNLTIIQDTLDSIERIYGKSIDINNINLEDQNIYSLFTKGETMGIFQFESPGMIRTLKLVKANSFNDLTAIIALFRPGPLEQIDEYAKRKFGKKKIEYLHNDLMDILKDTFGIIIYQEQILLILTKIAHFSLGKADLIRRGISKKDSNILNKMEEEFIKGCLDNGYELQIAKDIFNLIVKFANYGFPKAHSVAYALISYQMAYLKYYYPIAFYPSFMNTFGGAIAGNPKFYELINEASSKGVNLVCPCINESGDKFIVKNQLIIYPFNYIKELTTLTINKILQEREKGLFKHFLDFIVRLSDLDSKQVEILIMSGCFDNFKTNRTTLLANLDSFKQYAALITNSKFGQPMIDFSLCQPPNPILKERNYRHELNIEYELLGMFLSEFPLKRLRNQLDNDGYTIIANLIHYNKLNITLVGFIQGIRTYKTKKGDPLMVARIGDESGSCEIVLYSDILLKYKRLMTLNTFIKVIGNVKKEENISIIVKEIFDWEVR